MNETSPTELIVDDTIEPPTPLDPAIASLYLKTSSNRLTEGYDLSVSTFFGSERVQLVGGDFSVNVEISIDRAEVDLDFVRCRPSLIESDDDQTSDERRIKQRLIAKSHHTGRGKFLLSGTATGNPEASGSGEVELEAGRSTASDISVERTRVNWKRIGPKTIIIGTVVGDLEGMELDDFVGWRVIPDNPTETSGVVAILSVREDWINFIKVHSDSFVGKIGQKAKSLFETNDKKRQQLFALLLRHLSAKGLSRPSNPHQAVLAVHPFVVKPDFNHATTSLAKCLHHLEKLSLGKVLRFKKLGLLQVCSSREIV